MSDHDLEIKATAPEALGQLTAHPHSELFPMMSDDELPGLIADIEKHGQQTPIVLFEGQILDGRNRYRACRAIGIDPKTVDYDGKDALAFIISANLHRRHLTQAQKAEIVARLLEEQPERSNRAIGRLAHVDHKTVGAKRAELESGGEIPRVELREDTKGRSYPAHKEAAPSSAPAAKHGLIWSKAQREARDAMASVAAFLSALHEGDINRHINDLLLMLGHEKERIAALPKIDREALARRFLAVLDIVVDDLRPIEGQLLRPEPKSVH